MKITIVKIGSKVLPYLEHAVQEFNKRINGLAQLEFISLAESKTSKTNSAQKVIQVESNKLQQWLEKNKKQSMVVLLDVLGKECDTEKFTAMLESVQTNHGGHIVFVIGGAHGVDSTVLDQHVDTKISLSALTMNHDLALVVVLEQIYRGLAIMNGKEYHK